MATILLTQDNIEAALKMAAGTYFIIENTIVLPSPEVVFPSNSVLEFRGGSLHALNLTSINLNNSEVVAAAYCIFDKDTDVRGFANAMIHTEWFNDRENGMAEHEAINKALVAARGCPVTLEARDYYLTGTIEIVYITNDIKNKYFGGDFWTTQTLISPGILYVGDDIPAIDVYPPYVNLEINSIRGKIENTSSGKFKGIGIRLSGCNYGLNINVIQLLNLNKGFDVCPDSKRNRDYNPYNPNEKGEAIGVKNGVGAQYCKINFQAIYADYCLYIDIFSKSYLRVSKVSDEDPNIPIEMSTTTWFTESAINGGRMSGGYGIYVVDNNDVLGNIQLENMWGMDGLMFSNITFVDLSSLAIRGRNIQMSKFHNIDTRSPLPDLGEDGSYLPWFDLKKFKYTDMTFKGYIRPSRFKIESADKIEDEVTMVKISGYVIDDEGWYTTRFDTLVIMPIYDAPSGKYIPRMAATSSVRPYNMGLTLTADAPMTDNDEYIDKVFSVKDLLPYNNPADEAGNTYSRFYVLPRTVNLDIRENNNMIIDLTGLNLFAPCIIDLCWLSDYGGRLSFRTTTWPSKIVTPNYTVHPDKSVTFDTPGLYRLTWSANWEIVITQVEG